MIPSVVCKGAGRSANQPAKPATASATPAIAGMKTEPSEMAASTIEFLAIAIFDATVS